MGMRRVAPHSSADGRRGTRSHGPVCFESSEFARPLGGRKRAICKNPAGAASLVFSPPTRLVLSCMRLPRRLAHFFKSSLASPTQCARRALPDRSRVAVCLRHLRRHLCALLGVAADAVATAMPSASCSCHIAHRIEPRRSSVPQRRPRGALPFACAGQHESAVPKRRRVAVAKRPHPGAQSERALG